MTKNALYFLTGSSGSGKTTLFRGVISSFFPGLTFYHCDHFGVPSIEEMNDKFGGAEEWQAHHVRQWVRKIAESDSTLTILDSQARPTVIQSAVKDYGLSMLHITLIDCGHEERRRRLLHDRLQPELDHLDMYAWAAYLRGQADALNLEIIDTTSATVEESTKELAQSIKRFSQRVN